MSNAFVMPNKAFRTFGKGHVFDTLPDEDLSDLEHVSNLVLYPRGTVLFEEQREPQLVFLLLKGRVKLTVNSMDGKRFLLRVANSGELVGLASALTGAPYEMTAETLHPCKIASIKRAVFLHFLKRHPATLTSASLALASDYHQACARLRTLGGTPSVTAKLARLLLELSSAAEQETKLHLSLTHEDVGECIGACRESVTRSFRDLRSRNLIEIHGTILTITDRDSLELCAGS